MVTHQKSDSLEDNHLTVYHQNHFHHEMSNIRNYYNLNFFPNMWTCLVLVLYLFERILKNTQYLRALIVL